MKPWYLYAVSTLAGGDGLLDRFRAGERAALDEVYRTYVDSVARAVAWALRRYGARGVLGWPADAGELPDLVQEVFARAFEPQARERFDGARDYGAYIGQIARNVAVDHLRRAGQQVLAGPFADDFDRITAAQSPPQSRGAGDDYADPNTMLLVNRYIAQLPEDLRLVHDALYVRGLSQREAAEALGIGRQAIRTLEARLKAGLRGELAREGHLDARPAAPPRQLPRRSGSA